MSDVKSVEVVVRKIETVATSTAQAPVFRAGKCSLESLRLYGRDQAGTQALDTYSVS